MRRWLPQKSKSNIKKQIFYTNSLKEPSMVRNIPSQSIKKEKMVKHLQVLSLLWQQMTLVSKSEPLPQMRRVQEPLLAWSSKLILLKRFKLRQDTSSQKSQLRSAKKILGMTLRFRVKSSTKKKKLAFLVRKPGMTMTIMMVNAHQPSPSIF